MMMTSTPRRWLGAFTFTVAAFALAGAASAATLDTVKERGRLLCGVNEGLHGFGEADAAGKWTGFDVDFCRAVAAAIFGDAEKVEYVPLSSNDRFEALKAGKVDVLSRNSTWTMSRETDLGLTFVGVTYYDGQGFMVPRSRNVASALELGGSKVCVQTGTTTEANLADFFAANNMAYEAVTAGTSADTLAAYKDGRCNALTSDMSQLYALRLGLPNADDQLILPDTISKEPLGPAVRDDDPKWATLVKWVVFALVNGEELGVGTDTVDAALASKKPDVRRLVGTDGNFGGQMGLSNDWAAKALRLVGNYGEIYERNLGGGSDLGIPRGMNQLWSLGGIQYAPPIR
jgi:general L-amino acid transport system substrate-binding protein